MQAHRLLSATSLILGPLLLLTAVLLRIEFPFFFPHQLSSYEHHPTLITLSYSAFAVGTVLLCPAAFTLARLAGTGWAQVGAALAVLGLVTRTFHAGADHMAFRLVKAHGAQFATDTVSSTYQAFHVFQYACFAVMFVWLVLAVAVYRAGVLRLTPTIGLALMSVLPLGILKGSTIESVIATAGLCVALLPLGVRMLTDGPRPSGREVRRYAVFGAVVVALGYLSALG